MKTKELIRLLQEADPSGEIEVCVENEDIFFVEKAPAYWDGRLEILIRDESIKGYNVIGAKITSKGKKLRIRTLSIDDAIFESPDMPVEIDVGSPEMEKRYKKAVRKWRREAIDVLEQILNSENTPLDRKDHLYEKIRAGAKKIEEESK